MTRFILLLSATLLVFNSLYGQRLNIKLLSDQNLKSFIFSPAVGKYQLYSDSILITTLKKNDVINLSLINDSILVKSIDEIFGTFKSVKLIGIAKSNYAKLKCVNPQLAQKLYDDDLFVTIQHNRLSLINNVELESYVAGVVESEGGQKADIEYYKTQAVLCRTYALENFNRHVLDGYNLCDDVHCQAYKSKSLSNFDIPEATLHTKGLVIVDSTLNLITAGFHSNCGGQTVNSEEVWLNSKSYLISIKDTFCLKQRNANWTKTIPFNKWKQYLLDNGINPSEKDNYSFSQYSRKQYMTFDNDSIPLRKIRGDWNLRSTFFNVKKVGDEIVINGKGYGHGVGLCQEGAMQMAKSGYDFKQIILFYYKDTHVVSLEALDFFKLN